MTAPHTTVAPSTSPTVPISTSPTAKPPPRPTVPPDVPRTGPNIRKGEKPPVLPVAATRHTADGAKAFAAFFIKTIDWGYATTSSAYMRHYFQPTCVTCRNFATLFDDSRRHRQHFIGGRIAPGKAEIRADQRRPIVAVPFAITAFAQVTSTGHVVQADRSHDHERFDFTCDWTSHTWMIAGMALET